MEPDSFVVAAVFNTRPEAELVRAFLESGGIDAVVQTDDAGGFHPQLSMVRGVEVLVRSHDLEEAQDVLQSMAVADDPEVT